MQSECSADDVCTEPPLPGGTSSIQPESLPEPRMPAGHPTKEMTTEPGFLARCLDSLESTHRSLLRTVMIVLLAALGLEWAWVVTRRPDPLLLNRGEVFRKQYRVDVNTAGWVEWMQLEGLGPALAHRIVADRNLNGPFSSIDDVGRVPGIGPGKLDQIRAWLTISHDTSTRTTARSDSGTDTGGTDIRSTNPRSTDTRAQQSAAF